MIPLQEPLPPASQWRYYAFNALTGEWLHRELPLSDVRLTTTLSGPGRMTATIDPEYQALRTPDGGLVLELWQTMIVAEASGQLRGGGILTGITATGPKLTLDMTGVSGWLEGQPLRNNLTFGGKTDGTTGNGVDPLDVVRALWGWLQGQPDGNLAVTLDATTTPYRLGEWHNTRVLKEDGTLGPAKEVAPNPIPIDRIWDPGKDKRPVAATGKQVYWEYKIPWWDDVEIGQRVTTLATQTPFDWLESLRWADSSRESVVRHIHFGYPRLGKRLTREVFVEGANISELVAVRRDGDDYANSVTVYGSGEGSKQLRSTVSKRDGRLLRAKSVDRPDLTTVAECKAVAEEELRRWSQVVDILGFTVRDHPNAQIGTFAVGDDVLVQTRTGWMPTRLWVRITALDIAPATGEVTVTCRRSDRFDYPGGA